MTHHQSFEPEIPEDDGWYRATCSCGWEAGAAFPEIEMVVDELMAHAYMAGYEQGRLVGPQ